MAQATPPKADEKSTTTRKTTAAKSTPAKSSTAARTTATKRSTTAKKAAETRAANRGAAARDTTATKAKSTAARTRTSAARQAADATTAAKGPVGRAGDIAERSVLVPVGAALIARDRLRTSMQELRATYSTRKKTENELRRFERRGTSAMKTIERELRDRRTRMEKEVRSVIKGIETRTDPVLRNVELVGARVENAVQGGRTAATKASATVQERLSALA